MRLLLAVLALATPPGGSVWLGTWTDAAMGASGKARLVAAHAGSLDLDGAFGCIGSTVLSVSMHGRSVTGSGGNVACNRGLRWSLRGAFAGSAFSGTVKLRLADGSRAMLTLQLRQSR